MFSSLWLAIPLVVGNTWHLIMPFVGWRTFGFKNSISENATRSKGILFIHRTVHIGLAFCFLVYSSFLWTQSFHVAAILLIVAALFDTAQVLKLSSRTNHTPLYLRDKHQFLAWSMALFYLLFSIVFAVEKQLPINVLVGFVLSLGGVLIISFVTNQRYFWFAQMAFFVSTSTVMAVSAVL